MGGESSWEVDGLADEKSEKGNKGEQREALN